MSEAKSTTPLIKVEAPRRSLFLTLTYRHGRRCVEATANTGQMGDFETASEAFAWAANTLAASLQREDGPQPPDACAQGPAETPQRTPEHPALAKLLESVTGKIATLRDRCTEEGSGLAARLQMKIDAFQDVACEIRALMAKGGRL